MISILDRLTEKSLEKTHSSGFIVGRANRFLDEISQKYDEGKSHEVSSIEKFINNTETYSETRRLVRLVNQQRLVRNRLKGRLLNDGIDQGVRDPHECRFFEERIKEYEDSIDFNLKEIERLACKYGVREDFYFLPERNKYFFKLESSPYHIMEPLFLVISRITVSSINFLGIKVKLERG